MLVARVVAELCSAIANMGRVRGGTAITNVDEPLKARVRVRDQFDVSTAIDAIAVDTQL